MILSPFEFTLHGDSEQLKSNPLFLVSLIEDAASAERDGSGEAVRVCSRAHRPSGETETRARYAQLSGGKVAADPGG